MGEQPDSSIGARLRMARENKGMTQKEVADLLGVTRSVISRYESGINDPPTENVKIMSKAYDVSPNFIYGVDDTENKTTYDFQIILHQTDIGEAFILWHEWKSKYTIPQDEYEKGKMMICQHYGLPKAASIGKVAHGPNMPGTGIFTKEDSE